MRGLEKFKDVVFMKINELILNPDVTEMMTNFRTQLL